MSGDNVIDLPKNNVVQIDSKRIEKLKTKDYFKILDEAEVLRMKFQSGRIESHAEAYRFVTLCKYLMEFGNSESVKYGYKMIYHQFMRGL